MVSIDLLRCAHTLQTHMFALHFSFMDANALYYSKIDMHVLYICRLVGAQHQPTNMHVIHVHVVDLSKKNITKKIEKKERFIVWNSKQKYKQKITTQFFQGVSCCCHITPFFFVAVVVVGAFWMGEKGKINRSTLFLLRLQTSPKIWSVG